MNDSAFGLSHLWEQGDTVTHIVAIILLLMSIGTWFVIISKTMMLYQLKPLTLEISKFWQQTSWQNAINSLSKASINPFYHLASNSASVLQSRPQNGNLPQNGINALSNHVSTDDWLSRSLKVELEKILSSLQKGLAFLASTGATAPFIGLFGTVWGIYHALMSISSSGSASIDQVAGPIGEALIMTALGLAVAIPAVLAYNAISKSNRELLMSLRRFADDLHTYHIQTLENSGT
jgi:biopolymer transport protein ExbB